MVKKLKDMDKQEFINFVQDHGLHGIPGPVGAVGPVGPKGKDCTDWIFTVNGMNQLPYEISKLLEKKEIKDSEKILLKFDIANLITKLNNLLT